MREVISKVEDLIVYRKAMELFDNFIEEDLPILNKNFASRELAKNQIRSLDSICANMEEGFGRKAGKEFKQFFRNHSVIGANFLSPFPLPLWEGLGEGKNHEFPTITERLHSFVLPEVQQEKVRVAIKD